VQQAETPCRWVALRGPSVATARSGSNSTGRRSAQTPVCSPYRDLDDAVQLTESAAAERLDFRTGRNVQHSMTALRRVVKFYNGRGTAEQWIKEGKSAVRWTRLSCCRFHDNHAAATVCAGVPPGELPATPGVAEGSKAPVADDAAGEADQDRGEGGASRAVRDLPTGGGGRAEMALSDHPRVDSAVHSAPAEVFTDMKAPTVHQPGQHTGGWDVTAPRSCGSRSSGPPARSVCLRRAPFQRRFRPPSSRLGFGSARQAVEW
jgi:hypothetical protein